MLDRAGFSPGVIDGKLGGTLTRAVAGFQSARGLPTTGRMDEATAQALTGGQIVPGTVTLALTPDMLAGPFVESIPKDEDAQAKLPGLYYRSPMEKMAERFHTTPETIVALNSPQTRLAAGVKVVFPNVQPGSTAYPQTFSEDWRATLTGLNVDANEPKAAKVIVGKADRVLRVYDATGKLVAQFPVTTGSEHDPLPIGSWKIEELSYNPKFHFNRRCFGTPSPARRKQCFRRGRMGR